MAKEKEPTALAFWKKKIANPVFNETRVEFQTRLVSWFEQYGRDLPWRHTRDPYKILVSELMLQQTQVDRVIGFYAKFLAKFPTLKSIADASEEDVLAMWEGLGYYNRARNLKKTAQMIMTEYNGVFPKEKENILNLPGIGEYTAGAVMTFAFELRAPIVDTNVDRAIGRVFLNPSAKITPRTKEKILWLLSETLLPEKKTLRLGN